MHNEQLTTQISTRISFWHFLAHIAKLISDRNAHTLVDQSQQRSSE